MITYESVCEKLGFDPITDDVDIFDNLPDYEDDSGESPFKNLTMEELDVFTKHLIKNRDKLERYNEGYRKN